jgi:hypothetical protein
MFLRAPRALRALRVLRDLRGLEEDLGIWTYRPSNPRENVYYKLNSVYLLVDANFTNLLFLPTAYTTSKSLKWLVLLATRNSSLPGSFLARHIFPKV